MFNAAVQSLAITVMGIDYIKPAHSFRVGCFFIMFCIQAVFIGFWWELPIVSAGIVFCSIVLSFFIYINQKNYLKSINVALSILIAYSISLFILAGLLFFVGNMLFSPENVVFNGFMQISIVVVALFIRTYREYFFVESDDKKLLQFYLIFKVLVVLILSVSLTLMSMYFSVILVFVAVFIASMFLVVSMFFVKHIVTMENDNKKSEIAFAERLAEAKILNERYDEIIGFKHYMVSLYSSTVSYIDREDIHGLKDYYKENIAPIHDRLNKEVGEYAQLGNIQHELIKARIIDLINTVSQLPNVTMKLCIDDVVDNVGMKSLDLFTVLNIYIDNAIEETVRQDNGEIIIDMKQSYRGFTFTIKNTLVGGRSTPKPHNTHKGFEIITGIIETHTNLTIRVGVENGVFSQELQVGVVND